MVSQCKQEKELAEAVYWLVKAYGGRVNMYKGEKVPPVMGEKFVIFFGGQ